MKRSQLATALVGGAVVASSLGLAFSQSSIASAAGDKCYQFDLQYTDGTSDVGEFCGGNTVTRADLPGLQALSLHISCSDDFFAPTKSDLDGKTVTEWSIVSSSGKTCSSDDTAGTETSADKDAKKAAKDAEKTAKKAAEKAAKAVKAAEKDAKKAGEKAAKEAEDAAEKAAKSNKSDKCIEFDIQYTDGTDDVGTFCGGNTVTRADMPGLEATSIHISCSDDLYAPEKSDLAGKTVERYTLIKDGYKVCGDPVLTVVESPPTVEVYFDCYRAEIVSSHPIENSTVLYADGSTQYVWGAGRTAYAIESDGRIIEAVYVDGVRHDPTDGSGADVGDPRDCYVS